MQPAVRELHELISAEEIDRRVSELATEINEHYGDQRPLLIGVLNGAVIFMADLARKLTLELDFQFMAVSSYGAATESSGVVQILKDLDTAIEGREVLIVEDIIDSGLTVRYLRRILEQRRPATIRIVALLRKNRPEAADLKIDWVGFEIPDEFVVGYGLDMAGRYRNLPAVYIVELDGAAEPAAGK
jgi:hypoxanthine phosphoribosyltransferase